MHVFAEEGLRNFFDIIAITYEKGAKSSLYRALPDITSNRRYIGSPPCQQISSSLYRPFRYSGPRYIGPPTVLKKVFLWLFCFCSGLRMSQRASSRSLMSCTLPGGKHDYHNTANNLLWLQSCRWIRATACCHCRQTVHTSDNVTLHA